MPYSEGMFDLEEYPVEVRVRILAAQVNAAAGLGMWVFVGGVQPEKSLIFSTCLKEKEFLSFLQVGKCMDFLEGKKGGWDNPVVLSDSLGLIWVAEHAYRRDGTVDFLVVLGPLFISNTSRRYIEEALSRRVVSTQVRLQMARTLAEVPVISASALEQYCKILHYTLTSRRISTDEIVLQHSKKVKGGEEEEEDFLRSDAERVMEGEQHFLAAVKEGNQHYREILEKERLYNDEYVCDTGDPLRDAKDSVIAFTVLCGRAAMEGGLSAAVMRDMEKRFLGEVEQCRTLSELRKVKDAMLGEYVTCVRRSQESSMVSKSIRDCCDYIRANVCRPLTVQEIASHMGYTTYYFTKKFNREMGIKVTDYIKEARVEYAKVALLTTNQSIQEISDNLQFGSRNYFSKVFRSVVGVTPAAYRDGAGKSAESRKESNTEE